MRTPGIPATTLIAFAAAVAVNAEDVSSSPDRKPVRVGVINLERVGAQSQLGKGYAARIQAIQDDVEKERVRRQAELEKLEREIQALQEETEKQRALLSEDALETKQRELKKKTRDRQAFVDDAGAEIQRMIERAKNLAQLLNNELSQKIKPHMETVARQQGIDILLDSSSALTLNADLDISVDVIARADEVERTASDKGPAKTTEAAKQ